MYILLLFAMVGSLGKKQCPYLNFDLLVTCEVRFNSFPAKSEMGASGRPFRTLVLQVGNRDVPLFKIYDYHISIES